MYQSNFKRLALTLFSVLATAGASLAVLVGSASAAKPLAVCASGCPFTSISAAIDAATDGDRIVIHPGAYDGGLVIDKSISLVGSGATVTTINGVAAGGEEIAVTVVPGVDVTIRGVTIDASPIAPSSTSSGVANGGSLTLTESVVTGANSVFGAGILNGGTMALKASVVSDNFADVGGGIRNSGVLSVHNSLITDNRAGLQGGGITNSGTLAVKHTTVSNNTAEFFGGGILNTGTVVLKNTTFSNNAPDDCDGC